MVTFRPAGIRWSAAHRKEHARMAAAAGPDPLPRGESTEEEIQRAWVNGAPVHGAPILLVPYDPCWPGLYAREAERIISLLGGQVLRLEHVGSTSVPGLAAKP